MGINMPSDGSKLSVNLGTTNHAMKFREAVKNNDLKSAVPSFKSMADRAMLRCTIISLQNKSTNFGKELSKTPVVKMMSDPDWTPKNLADLLVATAKSPNTKSMNGDKVVGNLLYGLNHLNNTKVDSILTEIGKIDSNLEAKLNKQVTGLAALQNMANAFKSGEGFY